MRGFTRVSGFVENILKPTPGKVIIFAILTFFIFILPLYPVEMTVTTFDKWNVSSSRTYVIDESLALILIRGFEWNEVGYAFTDISYHPSPNVRCGYLPLATMEFTADPNFMPSYLFLFLLAYAFSGYLTERANWAWKGRLTPYVRKL